MPLKKFVSIKNVGRFHDSKAAGDVEFKKFTLIYGENGRGKTTICAILRSLQSGEPSHIVGRRTLGAAGGADVRILVESATPVATFQAGAWTQSLPTLAIFDQQHVSENVYVGDGVGPEQKRNLYKVIIGQDAVGKAQQLDQLVADIRKSSSNIRDATKAVESHLVPGLKLQALMDALPDTDIDEKIRELKLTYRTHPRPSYWRSPHRSAWFNCRPSQPILKPSWRRRLTAYHRRRGDLGVLGDLLARPAQ